MKKVIISAFAGTMILASAGCSPRATSVQPVSTGNAYSGLPCHETEMLLSTERQNVQPLSAAQNSAATGDAIGVFFLGVPVSNATGGNKAGDLGAAKGKVIALEQRSLTCKYG